MAFRNQTIENPRAGMSIKFLQTAADSGGRVLEMQAVYSPHSLKPIEHYHPHQDENFNVVIGEITVKVNGVTRILKAGDSLFLPRNTVHSMWNESDHSTVVNWQVSPALNTENFLELAARLTTDSKVNDTGKPTMLRSVPLASKYSNVFRVAKPPFIIQKILFTILLPIAYLKGYRPDYKKYLDKQK
jgi:quercetin dioxygenase-like cupin family protein